MEWLANVSSLRIWSLRSMSTYVESCRITTTDYRCFFDSIANGSVDLVLTDPPYTISRDTGFKAIGKNSVERFAVSMDFGEWDHSLIDLDMLCNLSYSALRSGGTAIIWYDIWKLSYLSDSMKRAGFKQIRLIMWNKTNPVPLNAKVNYLSNHSEVAVLGVKVGKPTFHGYYDNGRYKYPIPNNGHRYHPTQKPLNLFVDLVLKHSNEGDLVIDPFLGGGTAAVAATTNNRRFLGCDKDERYVQIAKSRLGL